MLCDWKDILAVFVAGFGLGGLVVFFLLEPHADNVRDMVARNRQSKGSTHGFVKLTEKDAYGIFYRCESASKTAKRYGVTSVTVQYIRAGRIWSHATGALREEIQ